MTETQLPHVSIGELVSHINSGDTVAIPTMLGDFSAVAMETTREIIRRRIKGLNIVCVPSSSLQADMLIGAGCVASIQAGAVLLYEYGGASRFLEALKTGKINLKESTCPAIQAGLTASEKGLPFMPLRGIIGSDIFKHRSGEWKVIDNPYPPHDPIMIVPAVKPDVAIFHAPLADRLGNVWVGRRGSLKLMSHAAKKTLVTYERLYDGNLFENADKVPGVLSINYVTAVSHQIRGSWPLHFGDEYPEDTTHMKKYAEAAKTQAGFDAYLDEFVFQKETA